MNLSAKLFQQQLLSPQMQQGLQLLQAPMMELRQLVSQELIANPMLEEEFSAAKETLSSSEKELSSTSPQAIYIGAGIGHAFLSLENESMISYLLDNKFDPSQEFALNPLDPTLEIMWPKMDYLLSEKDSTARSLRELIIDKKLPKQEY